MVYVFEEKLFAAFKDIIEQFGFFWLDYQDCPIIEEKIELKLKNISLLRCG
jgi:hypothetical protein